MSGIELGGHVAGAKHVPVLEHLHRTVGSCIDVYKEFIVWEEKKPEAAVPFPSSSFTPVAMLPCTTRLIDISLPRSTIVDISQHVRGQQMRLILDSIPPGCQR